jgi:restriction system protein
MPIPTYDNFVEPILRFLARHPEGAPTSEVHDAAAVALGLSDAERGLLLPSGVQRVYKNRAGWAHDRLKRAGLSSSPKRGFWQLTAEGLGYANTHPEALPEEEVSRLTEDFQDVRLRPKTTDEGQTSTTNSGNDRHVVAVTTESPDDALERAIIEIRNSVANELLDAVLSATPKFFEFLVLELLHAMGYGTSKHDLQRTGGSGDEGIDGIISLDRLGLEKVYVQAKRWRTSVGRPDVQAFYGALAGQRANKGVFITTSTYTSQAVEFAKSVERIVLVDGIQLASHMIEHGVGVSHRVIKLPKIDSDYFEE